MQDAATLASQALASVLTPHNPTASPHKSQLDAVAAVLAGQRVLCVQATGWGKSTVYFAACRALRHCGMGPTVVVSPLLALMRDQVRTAKASGLHAVTVNSSNVDEWDAVFSALEANAVDILFVSPERLAAPSFTTRLGGLLQVAALLVVDEAHCISDWGHDFRPDYRRLADMFASSQCRVLATTATANARVCEDISRQMGDSTTIFRGSLARASLALHVVPGLSAVERYAFVAQAIRAATGPGIVYAQTVAESEKLAGFLQHEGLVVQAYSSALPSDQRHEAEQSLRSGELQALVATSALGMGFDHPELHFVYHVGSPSSPVTYYQQVGRAGRAIEHAQVILLPAENDQALWDYFASSAIPNPDHMRTILQELQNEPLTVVALEEKTGIRRGKIESLLKIAAVEKAVVRTASRWQTTDVPWVFNADHYNKVLLQRQQEAAIMRSYAGGTGCLMEFLQKALDDPDATRCGRCSVCAPSSLPQPTAQIVTSARQWLRGLDTISEPRKRWPTNAPRQGTIAGVSLSRATAFADDPAWVDELAAFNSGEVNDSVVDAIVATVTRMKKDWPLRPASVVPLPSTHPARSLALAEAVAGVGRLPVVRAFEVGELPALNDQRASLARVVDLFNAMTVTTTPPGPVLLVADTVRTLWTTTVAASLLREAGVCDVYLVAFHKVP